jgi:hypothetical protein
MMRGPRRADALSMGWRDRDWARLSGHERGLLYGAPAPSRDWVRIVVWAIAGLLALLLVGYAARSDRRSTATPATLAPVVFGGPTADDGRLVCTAQGANVDLRVWVCTEWTIVQPGQDTAQAIDPGGRCGVRHVNQAARRWVCDSVRPPAPGSLPPPPRVPAAARGPLA